jgi:long-chain acyl-CoA synthetase
MRPRQPPGIPPAIAAAEAELLAPGGPFEVSTETVLGEEMAVFKQRLRSLREIVEASVAHGERDYVVFADHTTARRVTFVEHERAVASVATALRDEYGVGPGDRVAILAANCPEWIVTFWATVSLGAVAVGLNGWWTGPEIRYGIEHSEPTVLVADRIRLDRLGGSNPGVRAVTVEDDFPALWEYAPSAALPDHPIDEDDRALMLYTSGTTGRPKGAVHTHRNVIALLGLNFFAGMRLLMANPPPPDALANKHLMTTPLFHVSGLHNGAIAFLLGGITSIWTLGRFDPELVMTLIEREHVTGWSFTPTMLHRVVTHPRVDRFDLSSIRTGGGGGAPFSLQVRERAREIFPGMRATFGVGYGLTECSALATLNQGAEWEAFPDSVGRPMPTVEIAIRDLETGEWLEEGQVGEICIRGPMVMLEYWNAPDATAETIGPQRWLFTGDIGSVVEGRLFLAARRSDLILRGGENVSPTEIEQRLEEHPAVDEAAVVGVDHDDLGQEVHAFVVLTDGARASESELTEWVAEALAYYKVPSTWELRSHPLPRNAVGKVLRHELVAGTQPSFVEE